MKVASERVFRGSVRRTWWVMAILAVLSAAALWSSDSSALGRAAGALMGLVCVVCVVLVARIRVEVRDAGRRLGVRTFLRARVFDLDGTHVEIASVPVPFRAAGTTRVFVRDEHGRRAFPTSLFAAEDERELLELLGRHRPSRS